jgi:hypothetical protein
VSPGFEARLCNTDRPSLTEKRKKGGKKPQVEYLLRTWDPGFNLLKVFFNFFFLVMGFELKGLVLAIQMLYHVPSPFCFTYFLNKFSHLCLGQPGSRSAYLHLPWSWEWQACATETSFLLVEMGVVLVNFCSRWPQTKILLPQPLEITGIIGISHNDQPLNK